MADNKINPFIPDTEVDTTGFKTSEVTNEQGDVKSPVEDSILPTGGAKVTSIENIEGEENNVETPDDITTVENTEDGVEPQTDEIEYTHTEWLLKDYTDRNGIEFTDEEKEFIGADELLSKNFTDDPDAMFNIVDRLSKVRANRERQSGVNEIFEAKPIVKEFFNFVNKGGDYREFIDVRQSNYDQIEVTNSKEQHLELLAEEFQVINEMSKEQSRTLAKLQIDAVEDSTDLAKLSLEKLTANQAKIEKLQQQEQEAKYNTMVQNYNDSRNALKNKVTNGKLEIPRFDDKGNETKSLYAIPTQHREKIANAIITPYVDKDGNYYSKGGYNLGKNPSPDRIYDVATQADYYRLIGGTDADILAAYFFMEGGVDKLIDNGVNTKRMNRVKNMFEGFNPTSNKGNVNQEPKYVSQPKNTEIDWDSVRANQELRNKIK